MDMTPVLRSTNFGEYYVESEHLRLFVEAAEHIRRSVSDPRVAVNQISPHLKTLLQQQDWCPQRFTAPAPGSGMGSGIGTWLLYRAHDGGLAFSSLVVPSGAETPVHDHLAWGLVGLYRGAQQEAVYQQGEPGPDSSAVTLTLKERRTLHPGELYELFPECDIHSVKTISTETSVSLHLLGNDNGCIWRHRFDPEHHSAEPFRSGYLNVRCKEGERGT